MHNSEQQVMSGMQEAAAAAQHAEPNWSDLPLPALKAIGRFLDITSLLSARLACSAWCDGISSSVTSLLLTPAVLAAVGPEPLKRCLGRMAHLEHLDLALSGTAAEGQSRAYTEQHVAQLLQLIAEHGNQKKVPNLFAFVEHLPQRPNRGRLDAFNAMFGFPPNQAGTATNTQAAAAAAAARTWHQGGFAQGLQQLGPMLKSLRISDPALLSATPLTKLSQLEFLELNLQQSSDIQWSDLAKLPELHSLMLSPPISPSSSGLGPDHAQQVVPTLLNFSVPVGELLAGLTANPATAARFKQLLIQQTGSWNDAAVELLGKFTALEALRLFPGPRSAGEVWNNLAPVSKLQKLQELQLVGYRPVNFSNGAATGEALSASLPALRTVELVVEPESDQVAAIAALTQLTRLKLMLQPSNAVEGMDEGPPGLADGDNAAGEAVVFHVPGLDGLVQGLQGLMEAQAADQPIVLEAQLPHQQQQQQQQQPGANGNPLLGLQQALQAIVAQLPPMAEAGGGGANAGAGNAAAAAAGGNAAAAVGGGNAAAAPAHAAAAEDNAAGGGGRTPAGLGSSGGLSSGRASRRAAAAATARTTSRYAESSSTAAQRGSSSSGTPEASVAFVDRSLSSRFSRSRSGSGRANSSGAAGSAAGASAGGLEQRVSSFALNDIPDIMFSSDEEQEHVALANAKAAAPGTSNCGGSSSSRQATKVGVLGAQHTSSSSGGMQQPSSSSNPAPMAPSAAAAAAPGDDDDDVDSSSSVASDDDAAGSGSTARDSSDAAYEEVPPLDTPSSDSNDGVSGDEASSGAEQQAEDEDEAGVNGAAPAAAQHIAAAAAAAAAAAGAAAAANGPAAAAAVPPVGPWGLPAAAGTTPTELSCLNPLSELHNLQHMELLSPMIPITDGGLEPVLVGLREEPRQPLAAAAAAAATAAAGVAAEAGDSGRSAETAQTADQQQQGARSQQFQLQPALPNLKALTLSGTIHIGRDTYKKLRQVLPDLEELNLVHARPGDTPFDIFDDDPGILHFGAGFGGMEGVGLGGLGGMGGLGGPGGLGGGLPAGGAQQVVLGPFQVNVPVFGAAGGAQGPHVAGEPGAAAAAGVQPAAAAAGAGAVPGDAAAAGAGGGFAAMWNDIMNQMQQQPAGQQQQGQPFGMPAVQVMMQVNDNPPVVLAGGPGMQQQQPDGAVGQQQQQQGHFGNIMQQVMQQLAGQAAAGAGPAAAGQQQQPPAPAAAQQQQQQGGLGGPGGLLHPGALGALGGLGGLGPNVHLNWNILDVQIHQGQPGDAPAQIQMQALHGPGGGPGAADPVAAAPAAAAAGGVQGGLAAQAGPGGAAAAGGGGGGGNWEMQGILGMLNNMLGGGNGMPGNAAAGAPGQQQQQQGQGGAGAAAAAAAGAQQQQQQQQNVQGANVLPQGALGHIHHHHHHHPLFGMPGADDPSDFIAPTKISVGDLPPGLRRLQLVNVGIRSSKTPLPCPRLSHLQMERCKSARAFRVPHLSRCSKLTTLQLVNVHLEPSTIQHIADCCPALQRLCLTDYNAYASDNPVHRRSRVMPLVLAQQQPQQQQPGQGLAGPAAVGQQQQQGNGGAAAAIGAGGFGMVREVISSTFAPASQQRPQVDWNHLARLRCLVQFSLKSSSSHVLGAAQQLSQLRHTVKNLKLEAQGLQVKDLRQLGEQLVVLPHLSWLALVLLYRAEPPRRTKAAEGSNTAQQQPDKQAGDAAAAAAAAAAGVPGVGNGGNSVSWRWEPREWMKRKLMQELPGTALELRVWPA